MKVKTNANRLPESEIVERVIRNFVVKHRQARYLAKTKKPNSNGSYGFGELAHFIDNLDLRYCKKIPAGSQSTDYVLENIGALTTSKECYIIHESAHLDGRWMPIKETLTEILGRNLGAFIVVDNGDIIYHESEDTKERYIGVR
ncbi:hypothetical protein [Hymenobacter sp. DG25A]|uniref:hypothetical protein n=1 Tax=Hymenobacter sp. DG25A TaxID=1385663 RepID=UPI0012FB24E5|nr:hypothetical protein [Hymenobacter sp. DG25A]